MKTVKPERKFGRGTRQCRRCGSFRGIIRSYGLNYCRRCMREIGKKIGFKKYS